jgi:Domain of unknown function (DUF5703)
LLLHLIPIIFTLFQLKNIDNSKLRICKPNFGEAPLSARRGAGGEATLHIKRLFIFIALTFTINTTLAQPNISTYNILWKTQSPNSSASMPCGGGDIGLNVWVENGDVLFYLSKSGTFDENNAMLKLGRVRIRLSGNPFNSNDFKQELRLQEGGIKITGGGAELNLWVDVFRPVVHADVQSKKAVTITAIYESWRYEDHLVTGTEFRTNSYKSKQSFPVTTCKDEIAFKDNTVIFYHRNRSDVQDIFNYTVTNEGMDSVKDKMYNPLANNTFGGILKGNGMKPVTIDSIGLYASTHFKSWAIKTPKPVRSQQIEIALHVAQSNSLDAWKSGLSSIVDEAAINKKTALAKTREWWQQYWKRSYIFIKGQDSFVSQNYQLFRYQLGCNAYGKWPTKFNGGLFTFDPVFVDTKYPYSPDFRLWGGGTMTAQNQRLVYWSMLKSGDFEMMKSQFDFYLNAQTNAELRSKLYWNHGGACFTEQLENFGLPNITEYSIKRPEGYDKGMEYNAWLEYQWETVFEFCMMMLETERYEGGNITDYIPFIESCLQFYDEHYRYLAKEMSAKTAGEKSAYVFYPSSAAETYKMAYNSTTVISAMKVILERLLQLPETYVGQIKKEKFIAMLSKLPPIPIQEINGSKTLAPAEAWSRIQNTEAPQLYPVFPWGIYGVGKPNLNVALNTWQLDSQVTKTRSHVGWRQHNIFAARLGLTAESKELTKAKFANSSLRFPTFWGPGFDWTPDHNWGGAAMIGLQEMLLQTDDKKIMLFPAWPNDWDVDFKLHAPYQTTVEGSLVNGKLINLKVRPETRLKDIVNMLVQ